MNPEEAPWHIGKGYKVKDSETAKFKDEKSPSFNMPRIKSSYIKERLQEVRNQTLAQIEKITKRHILKDCICENNQTCWEIYKEEIKNLNHSQGNSVEEKVNHYLDAGSIPAPDTQSPESTSKHNHLGFYSKSCKECKSPESMQPTTSDNASKDTFSCGIDNCVDSTHLNRKGCNHCNDEGERFLDLEEGCCKCGKVKDA